MNSNLTHLIKNNLLKAMINFDNKFYEDNKKSKKYIFKGYINKQVILGGISLKLKIRYYFSIKNKVYIYPLYKKFGINKKYKLSFEDRMNIAKKVLIDKMSYESASYINSETKISKSQVHRYVKQFSNFFKYEANDINKEYLKNDIFICVDDTFKKMMVNKTLTKFRFRVINIYQRHKNKISNQIKICLIYQCDKNNLSQEKYTLNVIKKALNEYYTNNILKQKLIVCGDGAKFISNIANELKAAIVLDKFHCLANVAKVFNFRNNNRSLSKFETIKMNEYKKNCFYKIKGFLENNCFNEIYNIINSSMLIFDNKQKNIDLIRLKNYIKNNENNIKNWSKFSKNPTLTETYIQQIVKSNFGNIGKIYTLNMFINFLKTKSIVYNFCE